MPAQWWEAERAATLPPRERKARRWRDKFREALRGVKLGVRGHSSFSVHFFFAALAVTAACGKPSAPAAPPPPKVDVVQPVAREITDWDEYTARLEAVESVEVRPRVSGYLQSIQFRDGAMVKKGDLLFVIDPRPYEASLRNAEADLILAKSRLDLARKNLVRGEDLIQKRAISREEADERDQPAKASVFVFKDGKVTKRAVETDIADDAYISITRGLAAGDRIVTGPTRVLRFLNEGERVKELPADQSATGSTTEGSSKQKAESTGP